jgi:GNAT superfamily N-acetyltransferase
MGSPVISLTDAPQAEASAAIFNGLKAYNDLRVGYGDWRPLAVLVSDPETGETLGGLVGGTWLGVLQVDLVFLPEQLRGRRIGSLMLKKAEAEAWQRGCRDGVLMTMTFQAPEFYARQGWQEFCRIPCNPPGSARVYFRKQLVPAV